MFARFNRKMTFHFLLVFLLTSERSVWLSGKHPVCLGLLPIDDTNRMRFQVNNRLLVLFVKGGQGAIRKDIVTDREWKQRRGKSGVWRRTTWRQGLLHPTHRIL